MPAPWMGVIAELGIRLSDLVEGLSTWSQATFGTDAERGPTGPLKHLQKEAAEAIQAIGTEDFPVEMADILILWLDALRRGGITPMQGLDAALAKLKVNRARTWPKPVNDEPVEHVRD